MREGLLPPNLPNLTEPAKGFMAPASAQELRQGDVVLNLSVAMGGHNALIALTR
jgi:3-oxoacyl-(acyl-carrier-protein) synthase